MPRPPKLNPQQARLLIEFYLESGSISATARRFGISRSTAARIIKMNGESTLPQHNVNRKLKNPKPVKEYGYNKEKKRWNVYTTRSKRKNTKLNENAFNDLKDQAEEALATAEELEADRRKLRAKHQEVIRSFSHAPSIQKWLSGRNRFFLPMGPRRGSYCVFSLRDAQEALDQLLGAVRRGWWKGPSVEHIIKFQKVQKEKSENFPGSNIYIPKLPPNTVYDENYNYNYIKGLAPTKKDREAAAQWEEIRPTFIANKAHQEAISMFKLMAAEEAAEVQAQATDESDIDDMTPIERLAKRPEF
jgi:AraC-like DNA-binding protein